MSYIPHHEQFAPYASTPRSREDTNPPANAGFLRRLFNVVGNYRRRRAEREIARFIQGRGGHLTDELERDLMRHMTSSPHYWGLHL